MGTTPPADCATIIRYMRGRPLNFDPGMQYHYSNLGYCVLGEIIEHVTGQSYEAYVQGMLAEAGIFEMELGHTLFEDRLADEVRYYEYYGGTRPSIFPPHEQVARPYGAFFLEAMDAHGGWVASTVDLLRFMTAVDGRSFRPDLLTPASIQEMTARPDIPHWDGSFHWYGLGFLVNEYNNWWHDGALSGTRALLVRGEYEGLSWAVLCNTWPYGGSYNDFYLRLDSKMWEAAQAVQTWPTHDLFGTFVSVEDALNAPLQFVLQGNFPNPLTDVTTIRYKLPAVGRVHLAVYDVLGRCVAVLVDEKQPAGLHEAIFDADRAGVPNGVYFYRLAAGGFRATRSMVLVR